jgi:LytS/YehU family sensor histidine kinase
MAGWMAAAAAAAVLFSGVTWRTPWARVFEAFGVSLVFAACIVPIIAMSMPHVMPAVRRRVRFPFDWGVVIVVMTAIAIAGSAIGIAVLSAVGYVPRSQILAWFAGSVKISVIMTLIFGIAGTAVEVLQAQLQETTLALRTKERDEAEVRRAAAEAHLASLESRVNPHFLFNTLNSIAALTHENPAGAERMTNQLASLMRSSLDAGSSALVPLWQEVRVVRDYLEIETVRIGERLRFTLDVPDAAHERLVPRLSLQTLVENSVKFAVAPRREGGSIAVRATVTEAQLRLEVEDDGPGFEPAFLPDGHGLALLKRRLAMTYGERARLDVVSRPGRTLVAIEMPRSG